MKHVTQQEYGSPQVLKLGESDIPKPLENQSLIEIKSTSINRADTLQRQGLYAIPKGSTSILGLEFAGYELDENGNRIRKVMSILPGGGYSQFVVVNKDHLIDVPANIPLEIAGGICEVYLTAYLLFKLSDLRKGDSCLIYAAASGVGQAALQLSNIFGINAIASCSKGKVDAIKKYTKNIIIRDESIDEQFKQLQTLFPQGVNAIFDCIGKQNYKLTVDSLAIDGKWILYGLITGGLIENFNLGSLLQKRISLINTTLRSRPDDFKKNLIAEFKQYVLPYIANGDIEIPVDSITKIKWDQNGINEFIRLHTEMDQNKNVGKQIVVFE
ncbi:unnamed protein product [Paramecium primaurelia]|uniref:Enoyl reductase (ER) domain-containing protein n=1 Tax=Paramecium primaurelia TaxID=5886 RepID=A0A8S1JQQ6_PARPR|nr:unnamed protein product [Paramecium primaurelia]